MAIWIWWTAYTLMGSITGTLYLNVKNAIREIKKELRERQKWENHYDLRLNEINNKTNNILK